MVVPFTAACIFKFLCISSGIFLTKYDTVFCSMVFFLPVLVYIHNKYSSCACYVKRFLCSVHFFCSEHIFSGEFFVLSTFFLEKFPEFCSEHFFCSEHIFSGEFPVLSTFFVLSTLSIVLFLENSGEFPGVSKCLK